MWEWGFLNETLVLKWFSLLEKRGSSGEMYRLISKFLATLTQ